MGVFWKDHCNLEIIIVKTELRIIYFSYSLGSFVELKFFLDNFREGGCEGTFDTGPQYF